MTIIQTILLGAAVAEMLLLNICAVVACGQLHRVVEGINMLVDLGERCDLRQSRFMATLNRRPANHNYDPK